MSQFLQGKMADTEAQIAEIAAEELAIRNDLIGHGNGVIDRMSDRANQHLRATASHQYKIQQVAQQVSAAESIFDISSKVMDF